MTNFNKNMLLRLCKILGSPWTVYVFIIIALIGTPSGGTIFMWTQWFSSVFVQFVALSIIQGGTNLQSEEFEKHVNGILNHISFDNDRILEELNQLINK